MTASTTQTSAGRMASIRRRLEPGIAAFQRSDTAKAAALAGAMIANNVIALVSTVVFARLLGDYGSLGALISYLLILTVAGQAMQVATAREGVLGHLGVGHGLITTTRRWTRSLLLVTAGLTVVSVLLRDPIASAVGVPQYPWAGGARDPGRLPVPGGLAAARRASGRRRLQGRRPQPDRRAGRAAPRPAPRSRSRSGVTGAYLGSLLSYIAMAAYCADPAP